MIDRRETLVCAILVALMLVTALWRIATLDDWTALVLPPGTPLPALLSFIVLHLSPLDES